MYDVGYAYMFRVLILCSRIMCVIDGQSDDDGVTTYCYVLSNSISQISVLILSQWER